jgi:hypothetical protein
MGGGLVLPQPIPREAIRRYGRALRLSGEELADFVEIVSGIDDFWVATEQRKQTDAAVRAARCMSRQR